MPGGSGGTTSGGGLGGSTSGSCGGGTSGLGGTTGTSGAGGDGIAGPGSSGPGAGRPGIGTSTPGGALNSGGVSMLGTSSGGRFVPGTSSGWRSVPGTSGGVVWPGTSGGGGVAAWQRTRTRPADEGGGRRANERNARADVAAARHGGRSDDVIRLAGILALCALLFLSLAYTTTIEYKTGGMSRNREGRLNTLYAWRLDTSGDDKEHVSCFPKEVASCDTCRRAYVPVGVLLPTKLLLSHILRSFSLFRLVNKLSIFTQIDFDT